MLYQGRTSKRHDWLTRTCAPIGLGLPTTQHSAATPPWGPGKRRYLVSAEAVHSNGKEFFAPVQLKNGWWVETHASEENQIILTSRLIDHCGGAHGVILVEPM